MDAYNKYSQKIESRGFKISELLTQILKKWKSVLLITIVVTLMVSVIDIFSTQLTEGEEEHIITANDLTAEELEKLRKIESLEKQINDLREYRDNSVKMQINAYENYYVTLEYKLEKDNEIENLCLLYRDYILGGGLISDIASKTSIKERDLRDNLSIRDVKQTGEEVVSNVLIVQISHYDQEECLEIAKLVDSAILNHKIERMEPYDIVKISEYNSISVDRDLQLQQDQVLKYITDKENTLSDMQANLSVNLQRYLNNESNPGTVAATGKHLSKRVVLLGAILGVIFAIIIVVLAYVFNNTIKSVEEIENIYHIRVYGTIKKENKKRNWLGNFGKNNCRNNLTIEQEKKIVTKKVILACKGADITNIFISCASEDLAKRNDILDIIKTIEKTGIKVNLGVGMLYNPDVLEQANSVKNVILTEMLGVTLYNEVTNEVQLCEEYGIKVIGVVAFEQ